MIGKTLDGKYEIVRAIGEGGMGAVYEAVHVGVGRRVAVKVISADDLAKKESQVARFHREAKLAGGIETRHICQVFDTGTDEEGHPYMVMELMRGRDVSEQLKLSGPLAPEAALAVIVQACRGLQKAHDAGVIHRDIKPANLFLCEEEDGEITVKVLDFGIAKIRDDLVPDKGAYPTLTRTGALIGSPLYMSPEQARGKQDIDHRSDIYSLGVVLYRMLSGRAPFEDIDAFGDLLMSIGTEPPPPLQKFAPWAEASVAQLAHHALMTRREDRHQTATELMAASEALLPSGFRLRKDHLKALDAEVRDRVAHAAVIEDLRALSATQNALSNTRTDEPPTRRVVTSGKSGLFVGVAVGLVAAATTYLFVLSDRSEPAAPDPAAAAAVSPVAAPSSTTTAGSATASALATTAGSPTASALATAAGSPTASALATTASAAATPVASETATPTPSVASPPVVQPPRYMPPPTLPPPPPPPAGTDPFGGRK
ncbi:MAG: serine/threonine protein kinase [Deltaproteobacteria bacterium]|nr:serine/threonine protein kinase [Deltaproteobacteria bacterium]